MHSFNRRKVWFAALLVVLLGAGCCDVHTTAVLAPTVTAVTPLTGAAGICPNSTVTATFGEAMAPSSINATTFTVTGPGTTAVAGAVTYDASSNTATFTPTGALLINTTYTATLGTGAKSALGIALAANYTWTFTTAANGCHAPPVVSSVTPPSGSVGVCPNTLLSVTFSEAMDPLTVNPSTFTVSGGVTGTVTGDATGTIFTFTPSAALTPNQTYTATITTGVQDTFGNPLGTSFAWTFTISANGCHATPVVASVTPPDLSTGVCPTTIVSATFGQAMNPLTLNNQTFTLTGLGGTQIAGAVSYAPATNTAIFTPAAALPLNTTYTATITTGAMDTLGTALATNYVWTFTVGASSCLPAPPPASVSPANGAVGVCPSADVIATFAQPMNPATINAQTFTLTGPGLTPVIGAISADSTHMIFTFAPSSPLLVSTTYTATITTGAQDPQGNALATNFIWTFTTAAASCVPATHPTVVSVSPPSGSEGICQNSAITATFSKQMDPSTINTSTFTVAPNVTGTVTLDTAQTTAIFTPTAGLALNTVYTPDVSTGVKDIDGNALVAHFFWTFTTTILPCQAAVPLKTAGNFEVLAASTVTNTGPTAISGGNLGLSPGTAITGFPPGTVVTPAVIDDTDPIAAQAQADLTFAYNYAANLPAGAALPTDLAGLTLTPGLYTSAVPVMLSSGAFTLDAQGQPNAVFIFQIGSTLTTLGSTQIILAGGAQASNIYWQVGSSATLGTSSIFEGTIMALISVTLDSGASLQGRALASNGAVTLDSNIVTADPLAPVLIP